MEKLPLSQEGRIVMMFDCDIHESAMDTYAKFVPAGSKQRVPFLPYAFEEAYEIAVLTSLDRLHDHNNAMKDRQEELWDALPPKLEKILGDSRIQISLLINSNGGHSTAMKIIRKMIGWFRERKCPIDCYVTEHARSAAVDLVKCASRNNRHMLHTSELLWHEAWSEKFSPDTPHMERVNTKVRDKTIRFFRKYASVASEDVRRRIEDMLERAGAEDDFEITLTGTDLKEFGIVRHIHEDRASMLRTFQSKLPIKLGDKGIDPIAHFFAKPRKLC